ncbi:hypothetical protein EPT53_09270 [Fusobacterium necrophorum]|uniref:Toxin-antitoxin system YwqK family antitoxin n=1 Tax=Fusobacterium necrophorum TaxID=859 RepID=A0A4Q2KXF9_9FUSO|nr:hypothetical protein [Fusobacterium necrophorum]RXZ68593.1 hypothetical protein EPT53_09270 [Fusobacterium necrophorum]
MENQEFMQNPIGRHILYDELGRKKASLYYAENGSLEKQQLYYYPEGGIQGILFVQNGEGTLERFDQSGRRMFYAEVKLSKNQPIFHGKFQKFDENGKEEISGYYLNGEKIGKWKEIDENGKKIIKNYEEKKERKTSTLVKNGTELASAVGMVGEILEGRVSVEHGFQKLTKAIHDLLEGKGKESQEQRKNQSIQKIENDSEIIEFHANGNISCHIESIDKEGKIHGFQREYWGNGGIKKMANYDENGVLDGECVEKDSLGKILKQAFYQKGELERMETKTSSENTIFTKAKAKTFDENEMER